MCTLRATDHLARFQVIEGGALLAYRTLCARTYANDESSRPRIAGSKTDDEPMGSGGTRNWHPLRCRCLPCPPQTRRSLRTQTRMQAHHISSRALPARCVALLSHWQVRPNAADECSGQLHTIENKTTAAETTRSECGLGEGAERKEETHVTQSARPLTGATVAPRQSLHVLRPVPDANLPGAHA